MEYRHEYKYYISAQGIAVLRPRLQCVMKLDQNTLPGLPYYTIRSLYFDNPYNSCYYDNQNGNNLRAKYRLRIYNGDGAFIRLERKSKTNGKTAKQSCLVTQEQCRLLMQGQPLKLAASAPPLLQAFNQKVVSELYRPRVITEYNRVPFVHALGNVRVTFDCDIASSDRFSSFLQPTLPKRMILPTGMHLMECKFDELFPQYIKQLIEIPNLQYTAFSKYYLCRRYSLGG